MYFSSLKDEQCKYDHGKISIRIFIFFFIVKHNGNITIDNVYEIARILRPRSLAKELTGTVKEVLGTCNVSKV